MWMGIYDMGPRATRLAPSLFTSRIWGNASVLSSRVSQDLAKRAADPRLPLVGAAQIGPGWRGSSAWPNAEFSATSDSSAASQLPLFGFGTTIDAVGCFRDRT